MKKEMKIRTITKLTMLSSIFIIMLSMCGGIFLANTAARLVSLNAEKNLALEYGQQLSAASDYLTDRIRSYSATGETSYYDDYWNEINETQRREKSIEGLTALGIHDNEMEYISKMKNASDKLVPLEEEAMDAVAKGDKITALSLVYGKEYQDGKAVVSGNGDVFNETLAARYDGLVNSLLNRLNLQIVAIEFLLVLVLMIVISNQGILRRKVTKPLILLAENFEELSVGKLSETITLEESTSEIGILTGALKRTQAMLQTYIADISQNLGRMANGDMTVTISREYVGDFQEIKNSINHISESMRTTLKKLDQSAEEVSNGSRQMAGGAQALSQGTTEQASAIEQLAATISEISEQVKGNAEDSERAHDIAGRSRNAVQAGDQQVQEMVAAIRKISDTSSEIGKIIKTIDDIAFQTNILALNAAVEAARAGEAGKGFAVVADEVRNLAGKSAEAASSTTTLIENSILAVQRGESIAEKTADSLRTIVENTEESTQLVKGIAESANRQAEAIAQVTEGIGQISSVVQTNSATAEQSAAASEELSGQADILKSLVGRFKLAD